MSDQAVLTDPGTNGISAGLQERIRAFTAFYEQHAYLAYNLALRITCDADAAARAVGRAFLGQLDAKSAGLVPATTVAALDEAPKAADPRGAGDAEAQALMVAMTALAPSERAALALTDLAGAAPDGIGEALGVAPEQAAKLLDRGREAFCADLRRPAADAEAAARDWMWAAPPDEIWEDVYPRFHSAVERQLRRGAVEQTLVLNAAETVVAPGKGTRTAKRRLRARPRRWGRLRVRRPRIVASAVVVVVALAGVAAWQLQESGSPSDDTPAFDEAGTSLNDESAPESGPATSADAGDDKPHKPLTAALLDKLRLRELRQLREYTKRQADRSLPARQRRAAARRITALERAARARLRAQRKRESAIQDRQARQRARSQAPPPPPAAPRDAPSTTPSAPSRTRPQTTTPSGPPSNEEAERSCLLDESSGQYICPH